MGDVLAVISQLIYSEGQVGWSSDFTYEQNIVQIQVRIV